MLPNISGVHPQDASASSHPMEWRKPKMSLDMTRCVQGRGKIPLFKNHCPDMRVGEVGDIADIIIITEDEGLCCSGRFWMLISISDPIWKDRWVQFFLLCFMMKRTKPVHSFFHSVDVAEHPLSTKPWSSLWGESKEQNKNSCPHRGYIQGNMWTSEACGIPENDKGHSNRVCRWARVGVGILVGTYSVK